MAQNSGDVLKEYSKYVDVDNLRRSESSRIGADLSRFDSREGVKQAVEEARREQLEYEYDDEPQLRPRSRISFSTILIFMLFAALASLLVSCYVRKNAMLVELSSLKNQYSTELSRNGDLQTKYDQRYVLKDVEEYAVNTLGMVKYDSNQIEYIEIDTPETITRVEDQEEGTAKGFLTRLQELAKRVLGFLA